LRNQKNGPLGKKIGAFWRGILGAGNNLKVKIIE